MALAKSTIKAKWRVTMFGNILVPLDGSLLSEKALPLALQIARRTGASIRLTCVVPPPIANSPPLHPGLPRQEQGALDLTAWHVRQALWGDHRPANDGNTVQTSLVEGPVAPTLAEYAAGAGADLIVMTTHGRGAVSRFWLGSVTDELVRRSRVPVLVVRPADSNPVDTELTKEAPIRRVIVPLDGSTFAEAALGPATALARLFGATLELFHAVPMLPVVIAEGNVLTQPAADVAILDEMIRQGKEMVERTAARLTADGLKVKTTVVVAERVATAILDHTKPGDIIALATHARPPAVRWFLGSVADKLIRGADVPVLVVRPTGKPT
jgi:nucleotide-binding universal stress UspA family protein